MRNLVVWTALGFFNILLAWSYALNPFQVADREFFSTWQLDSQAIVESSLAPNAMAESSWGLIGRVQQLGLQGHFFRSIQEVLGWGTQELMMLTAFLTASILTILLGIFWQRGNRVLAAVFGYVVITSPWLTASAKNLYWVPWTLFLPMVIASLLSLASPIWAKFVLHSMLFLAFAFRFSTGYEFMTSVVLAAAATPFIFRLSAVDGNKEVRVWQKVVSPISILVNGVFAFMTVLLTHGLLRGEGSLRSGLDDIWRQDVLRRTYGDSGTFDPVYGPSLDAGLLEVVGIYLFSWTTPLTNLQIGPSINIGLPEGSLMWLVGLLSVLSTLIYLKGHRFSFEQIWLLILSISAPLSWFMLAKSHSYIHSHINFLLWYPLAISVLLFSLVTVIKALVRNKSPRDL